jgi:hypothetical protein
MFLFLIYLQCSKITNDISFVDRRKRALQTTRICKSSFYCFIAKGALRIGHAKQTQKELKFVDYFLSWNLSDAVCVGFAVCGF